MRSGLVAICCWLLLTGTLCAAQNHEMATPKVAVPGLQLKPLPEILNAQVPQLPPGRGLVVEQIGAEASKNLEALKRFDVLLSFDGQPLRDIEQFNRLVLAAKPDHKANLVVLRGGKEVKLLVSLFVAGLATNNLKGAIKPGGLPAVAIECTVLDGGKLQIALEYYPEGSSKLETVTCNGTLPEIEKQVRDHQLPNRVEELVDVAIKRLKMANQR